MPVQPKPYKLVCPKCGFTKIVTPKSDVVDFNDLQAMNPICTKCKEQMKKKKLNSLDSLFSIFK